MAAGSPSWRFLAYLGWTERQGVLLRCSTHVMLNDVNQTRDGDELHAGLVRSRTTQNELVREVEK